MRALLLIILVSSIAFAAKKQEEVKKYAPDIKIIKKHSGTPIAVHGFHVVQKGDTIFGIARYYEVDYNEILSKNNLTKKSTIKIGQKIKIPTKEKKREIVTTTKIEIKKPEKNNTIHIVTQGETLFGIARHYKVNPIDLATENNMDLNYLVKVGQKIKIPNDNKEMQTQEKKDQPKQDLKNSITNTTQKQQKQSSQGKQNCQLNFIWPTHSRTIAKKFGGIINNGTKIDGIIIATEKGNNVFASQSGTVAYAGTEISEYGKLMIIKHKNNWLTIYGYMDSFNKSVGQSVKAGDIIGKSGNSGDATESSIYFSIRHTKKPYNPETCL